MSILYYFIDEETRKLRPEAAHKVAAQKDHNADVIRVGIPETMNAVDLETSAVRCMYQRPKETEVRSKTATYYDTSGGYLWYDWTLQEGDTAKAGKINFSVCLQHIEGGLLTVDWNTTIGEIRVKTSYHSDDSDEGDETITPTVAQRVAVLESMIQRVASGAPVVVSSVSEMTDTEQLYVLSTDGNWYYHNGTAWVSGGTYGAVATDTTLTQAGIPADAKAVGDALAAAGSVTTDKLADGAITTAKIADGAVTAGKISIPVIDAVAENYTEVKPDNWHNTETDTVGILKADGTVVESTTRFYTDYIAVSPGDKVRAYASSSHNRVYFFNYTYYDSAKVVMPSVGRDTSGSYDITVPEGATYIRMTFDYNQQSVIIITINLVPTDWSIQYFAPYYTLTRDMVTEESQLAIDNAKNLKSTTVKGTNLVTNDNTYVGIAYWGSNRIVIDSTQTTYRYVVVPLKQNTRYWVNAYCRYYIFTDDNDNRISSGNTSLGKLFFDSRTATKLYFTLPKNNYDLGFIISEGYSGTLTNVVKPTFLNGLNQLMFDSWFAVALPPRTIRFTVGISEKLYYYNILSLAKNMIDLSLGSKDEDGVTVSASSQVIDSNAYGYTVYDDNLSVVANAPRGGRNRLTIRTDNVQDCSALIIGDSIIARNNAVIGQTMLDAFVQRNKTLTLFGTLGTGDNKHEGRPGWTVADYFSNKTYEGVVNPFYNPVSETFDFSYYMTNSGYSAVDYICIHLGGNDLFSTPFSEAREKITQTEELLCEMIDNIIAWNPNQKIIIQLAPTTSPKWDVMNAVSGNPVLVRAKFSVFNAEMFVILTKYSSSNVRISNDYMIVDPNNELADHIHPNNTGLAKIGMELVSQINCWQNE